jgi:hypothetical protein
MIAASLDHHDGAPQQSPRHVKADRFGGLEADRQLILGRRLDRNFSRLPANAIFSIKR